MTIHYSLRSKARRLEQAREQIESLHRYAATLDLEYLGPLGLYEGAAADYERAPREDDERRWFLVQSLATVQDPDDERCSYSLKPSRIIGFSTLPASGSEPANFGLARYPP